MFISDPNLFISDPGFKVEKISDSDPQQVKKVLDPGFATLGFISWIQITFYEGRVYETLRLSVHCAVYTEK
jgi:hypothetical protein